MIRSFARVLLISARSFVNTLFGKEAFSCRFYWFLNNSKDFSWVDTMGIKTGLKSHITGLLCL
jgi:hypothetical protein